VSSTLGKEWQLQYLEALAQEAQQRHEENGEPLARTIYIGGGTPSQLCPEAFDRLVEILAENFGSDNTLEFTFEANPDDVTPAFAEKLGKSPVNRVSLGVQSLDDNVLKFLHRRHNAQQALQAIARLQKAGIENVSADLIYGLPGQSLQMFESDVCRLLATGIPHLSAYALQFEEGTKLWKMKEQKEIEEADDDLSLSCYQKLIDLTEEAGLQHYEISNFARPGFRSKHNSSYWQGMPYLGLGAGAHSYDGKRKRRANTPDVKAYIAGDATAETETLSTPELYDERVMLSLRTCEGLSLCAIQQDFGPQWRAHCEQQAKPHLLQGTLKQTGETLCLTRSGLFISDLIITDLMA